MVDIGAAFIARDYGDPQQTPSDVTMLTIFAILSDYCRCQVRHCDLRRLSLLLDPIDFYYFQSSLFRIK